MQKTESEFIIQKTVEYVKNQLDGAEGGHDWWHIAGMRIWKTTSKSFTMNGTERYNPGKYTAGFAPKNITKKIKLLAILNAHINLSLCG